MRKWYGNMTIIGLLSNKTRVIRALLFHVQSNIVSRGGMISIQCPMFSEWALWGCLIAVFVFVLMIWIRDVKNANYLRQQTALIIIFSINRFQKTYDFTSLIWMQCPMFSEWGCLTAVSPFENYFSGGGGFWQRQRQKFGLLQYLFLSDRNNVQLQ